ncbi:hypothetical protein [Helicobacter sp. L8]|uniref:hypothetical protein n=1 Tax=Helicobacter sp. L8 TaxID=2316078 RepID=UPI000EB330DC|nr:hypothetical protein [Helicobacter sp. L8]
MEKLEWNAEQKAEFLGLLQEFVDLVDKIAEEKAQTRTALESAFQDELNLFLKRWGYECLVRISGRKKPVISFFRKEILKKVARQF